MAEPSSLSALEHLAALERSAGLAASTEMQRTLSRQRFLSRIEAEVVDTRAPVWRWALPIALAGCLAAALLFFLRTPALTFEVKGAELSRKYVSAPEQHAAEVRFSDESVLVVAAGSRLRVEDTSPRGARVLLERGRTSVHVVHEGSTAWTFAAGPFEVRVTGTRFDLAWDPADETCALTLQEGSVEVRGLGGSGPLVVRAGERFEGDARRRIMQVRALEPSVAQAPSSAASGGGPRDARPSSSALPSSRPEASPPASPSIERGPRLERHTSWSEHVAQGKFKEVVSEAEARGTASCLANCAAADLRALADAARYTGKSELAERSLTSLRQRFPGPQGSEAAFLLGRLHEKRGTFASALAFYDSYLREASAGAFAAEALAGKLRAVRATQGRAAAQPLARDYLRRFPKGVHVSTAREILGEK